MSTSRADVPDEGSEADRLEQQRPAWIDPDVVDEQDDVADEAESLQVADMDASEGDIIEQAQPAPLDDDEDRS